MRARRVSSAEIPIPIDDVRLVFKPEDSEKEVIVRYIEKGERFSSWEQEPHSSLPRHRRYIAGTDMEIPYPQENIPEQPRYSVDTPRIVVTENGEVWTPGLLESPFAASIADELIPKYSRKRVVHEDSYITTKILEDARSAWYESRQLKTPTVQKHEQEASSRRTSELQRGPSKEEIFDEIRSEVAQQARP